MYQNFIGIDISKHDFVIAMFGDTNGHTFDNSLEGFELFFEQFEQYLIDSLVVLETTGGYEMALLNFLLSKEITVHRADTRKVKYFIRSLGTQAKTDLIDAQGIAQYAFERQHTLQPFSKVSKNMLKLQQLMQRRCDLNKMKVAELNRKQAPMISKWVKESCTKMIALLREQINELDEEIDKLLLQEQSAKDKLAIIEEVDGIGEIISKALLIMLPELGIVNRRQIASLAGLAPHPYESGKKKGYRRTKGGRSEIRAILYMGAMSASRSKGRLGEYYRSLIVRGKKPMVALTALMRKMLVIANAKMAEWYQLNSVTTDLI